MFALAADMTLSHIFFWGSKEERVNEWSQDALKKKNEKLINTTLLWPNTSSIAFPWASLQKAGV